MSVEANIVVREAKGVLLVPAEAVREGAVMLVQSGRLARQAVTTGIRGTRMVEIVSGLDAVTTVVSPFTAELHNGMRVRVLAPPAARP